MKKTLLALLIIMIMAAWYQPVFSLSVDELNRQIKEKQDNMKQLEDKIEVYKKSIEAKQNESLSLSNQLSLLDSRITKTELDIQLAQAEIDSLNLEIESLQFIIQEKEKSIAKQKVSISKLLQQINISDGKSYLEVLLSDQSFSSYFDQVKYLENINTDLVHSSQQIKRDKAEVEAKQRVAQSKKDRLEEVKNTLNDSRAALVEQKDSKQYLLNQTKLSENKFKLLLAQLRQEYSSFDQEVATLQRKIESEMANTNKLETGALSLIWPTNHENGISAYFHDPTYPFRFLFEHSGLDIKVPQGTPVYAAAAGYVAWVRNNSRSYGNNVMIIHSNGVATLYGHLSRFNVSEDNYVKRGDLIGWSGGTPGMPGAGFSTGAHLHFEVRENGLPVDPLDYLTR